MKREVTDQPGAPSYIITEQSIIDVEEMAKLGMQEYQIALCLGMAPATFIKKKKAFPQLNEALQRGQAQGIRVVARGLMRNATAKLGKFGQPGGHVGAQKFYLSTKGGFTPQVEIRGSKEAPIVVRVELPTIDRGPKPARIVDAE